MSPPHASAAPHSVTFNHRPRRKKTASSSLQTHSDIQAQRLLLTAFVRMGHTSPRLARASSIAAC